MLGIDKSWKIEKVMRREEKERDGKVKREKMIDLKDKEDYKIK